MSHPFAGLSSHNKPPLGTPIGFLNAGLPAKHHALQMYFYTIVYGNQSQVRVLQEIWHFQPPVCLSATCHVETIVFACYQLDRIH